MTFAQVAPSPHFDAESGDGPTQADQALQPWDSRPLVASVAVAGLVTALSGLEPTGTVVWDAVLSGAMAVLFVLAAARVPAVVLVGSAVVAVVFAGLTIWLGIAAAGLLVAMAAWNGRRTHLQAPAGALTIVALTHLSTFGVFGFSAVVAGLAVLIVLIASYPTLAEGARIWIRRVLTWLGLAIGFFLVVAVYQAIAIRATAESGVDAARQGLTAARAGDTPELTRQLDRAQQQLSQAESAGNSLWLEPLKLVPVAAQHVRSLNVATGQGLIVANEASAVLRDVDLSQLQLRQGQFDLGLLASMAPKLVGASTRLEEAVERIEQQRSPWLLPPVANQLGALVDEANDVLPETQIAAVAAEVMPGLLGADGERRYLMLFGAPGESREFGGFIGGYALVSVLDGGLELVRAGSITELEPIARQDQLDDPGSYPTLFTASDPGFYPQNLTSSPNLHVIARAARDVFPELEGAPIDGLIYADPFALAAMTEFTGPLAVAGIDEPLGRDEVVDFMFDGQYRVFANRSERFGAFGALAAATAAGFENADLPGPERLGAVLGPVARAGRLQVITYDDDENAFLQSVLLQRALAARPEVDVMAIIQGSASESKLDLYLQRDLTFDVTVRGDGSLSATVDVVLTSDVPADAPDLAFGKTDGTNEVLLSLYTPHDIVTVTVDGQPHRFVTHPEFGLQRHALFRVPVEPNTSATVQFVLRGQAPVDPYRLELWSQPLVQLDTATAIYRSPGQAVVTERRELVENWLFAPEDLPS